jgi:Fe-S-cluster containining protein
MIPLFPVDVSNLEKATGLSADVFGKHLASTDPNLDWVERENLMVLKESKGRCAFLRGTACSVYEYRPLACRLFPFTIRDHDTIVTHSLASFCPGLGEGMPIDRKEIEVIANTILAGLKNNGFRKHDCYESR